MFAIILVNLLVSNLPSFKKQRNESIKMPFEQRRTSTRAEIIRLGVGLVVEEGYSKISFSRIAKELNISLGNITFYFPTKEHLLAMLVKMLCRFQWGKLRDITNENTCAILAFCLELATLTACSDADPIVRDMLISAYTHQLPLDIIRRNDSERAAAIFSDYCDGWNEQNYREAEVLVSGIEYATFMKTESSPSLDVRISGAIGSIMMIYGVPREIWRKKVDQVLAIDYHSIGKELFAEFIEFTSSMTEEELDSLVRS